MSTFGAASARDLGEAATAAPSARPFTTARRERVQNLSVMARSRCEAHNGTLESTQSCRPGQAGSRIRSKEHRHIDLIDGRVELVQWLVAGLITVRHAVILDIAEVQIVEGDAAHVERDSRS